ncbi:MAG: hypothetical protein EU529_08065 [Promethearchaeota archaeon]|nr:MAG: hypothetical protein EU529_08065 [Candidatus Lokiarchaeota archaeon]
MFPPIPAITDEFKRKERVIESKTSVLECKGCQAKYSRPFKPGDFTFKKLTDEECQKCGLRKLTIVEVYSEWIDPKKKK